MAISSIPNQIASFRTAGTPSFNELNADCNCMGRDFCQIVIPSDNTQAQFYLTEYNGNELVSEGDFAQPCGASPWTCGADWNIVPGSYAEKLATGISTLSQGIGITDGNYYKGTFTLDQNSGNAVDVLLGGNLAFQVQPVDGDGTYTFYYFASGSSNDEIAFTINGVGATARISDVSVKVMSSIGYQIKDSDGNVDYEATDGTDITYFMNASSSDSVPTSIPAILAVDWTNVSNDACYSICILDTGELGVELILDGDFPVGTPHWAIVNNGVPPPGWVLNPGNAQHVPTGAGQDTLTQNYSTPLDVTKCYSGSFTIQNYNLGEVIVRGLPSATTYGTFSGNGSKSFSIPVGDADTGLRFIADNISTPDYEITDVSVRVDASCLTAVYESECFKLQSSCTCCVKFTATNDENAFGFNFTSLSFTQTFRHCAKINAPNYPRNKDSYRDSSGDRSVLYSSVTKVGRLKMEPMPEYIHDAFNLMLDMDTLQIDGVQYGWEEADYEPDWVGNFLLAPLETRIIKDNQDLVNDNC